MIKSHPLNIITRAAFLLGCFFVHACENDYGQVQDLGKKKVSIEEGKNIESYLSQNGLVKAKLTAPVMLRYQVDTPKTVFPKSLHVDFFDDKTVIESELRANFGQYLKMKQGYF